jgi:toxin ParE1/3/4
MADYKLSYSSLFYKDLNSIIDYISLELKNEHAAKSLIQSTELAIKKRLNNPLSSQPYLSLRSRQNVYRKIAVGNYLIFYVVIDSNMKVRRMLHGRRNLGQIL